MVGEIHNVGSCSFKMDTDIHANRDRNYYMQYTHLRGQSLQLSGGTGGGGVISQRENVDSEWVCHRSRVFNGLQDKFLYMRIYIADAPIMSKL